MVSIPIPAVSAWAALRGHGQTAIAAAGLWSCLVLGGGTKAGFLADVVIQLLAVGLLALLIACPRPAPSHQHTSVLRFACVITGALVSIILLQLVPLPPGVWQRLPGRERWAEMLSIAGQSDVWRPLSLSPELTWLALMSLLPPIVVFWATASSSVRGRRVLLASIVVFAAASGMLGLAQVAQGEASGLRPFEITNRGEAVGLFANRNHFSALLYAALLLSFPWAAVASSNLMEAFGSRRGLPTSVLLSAVLAFTTVVVLLSAQAITRSRAGMALTVLAVCAGVALTLGIQQGQKLRAARVPLAAVLLALVFAFQFTLYRNLERFDADPLADTRIPYAQNTWTAALAVFPFGAGVGSFVEVYGSFERLQDLHATFANRAHNDVLEGWLELGVPGAVVLLLFVFWYLRRTIDVWWRDGSGSAMPLDRMLARAAALTIVLIAAHSFVDYPLRTGAISALFALCCGLLVPPPRPLDSEQEEAAAHARRREAASRSARSPLPRPVSTSTLLNPVEPPVAPTQPVIAPSTTRNSAQPETTAPTLQTDKRWGEEMQWPEAWRDNPTKPADRQPRPAQESSWQADVERLREEGRPRTKE